MFIAPCRAALAQISRARLANAFIAPRKASRPTRLFHVSAVTLRPEEPVAAPEDGQKEVQGAPSGKWKGKGAGADVIEPFDFDDLSLDDIFGPEIDPVTEKPMPPDDSDALTHLELAQHRRYLYYLRLIEHEMPQLVAYRKPFIPPSPAMPLVVRSISYGGEAHPATVKRTIVVPVAKLPLKGKAAIHKFKLLAGVRWSQEVPRDAGLGEHESSGEHGYIKISCEDFPKPAMNMKWASDVLDKLIVEANNAKDTFEDIPLDTRHLDAKARKAKKGEHARGRGNVRPSIRDFPKEWLPQHVQQPTPVSS